MNTTTPTQITSQDIETPCNVCKSTWTKAIIRRDILIGGNIVAYENICYDCNHSKIMTIDNEKWC